MFVVFVWLALAQLDAIDQARSAFASGDYKAAALASMNALRRSPNDPQMLDLGGLSFLALNDFPHAIAFFQREASLSPLDATPARHLAQALFLDGRFDDAYKVLSQLTASNPGDGENWTQMGQILYKAGYYAAALTAFEKALLSRNLPRDTNFVETLQTISWVEIGSLERAARKLPELLARPQNSSNLDLRLISVRLLYETGNLQRAIDESDAALSLAPENAVIHLWRARIFQRQAKVEAALAEAERCRELSPTSPAPRNLLVRLYEKVGRSEDAHRETVWLRDHEAAYSTAAR